MGEFPFSFALQCANVVEAEAEEEAEEEAMRRREGLLGCATGGFCLRRYGCASFLFLLEEEAMQRQATAGIGAWR
jgi:hypothetical protein